MNNKTLLIGLFTILLTLGFKSWSLVKLTIVNQANIPIAIQLINERDELFYYLNVPSGDRDTPMEKTFTITPALYEMTVYYLETYDPVYHYPRCGGAAQRAILSMQHSNRVLIKSCTIAPANVGEPGFWKFWPGMGGKKFLYIN